ncbi:MAG: immunoglobulin domain-containing protein [Verrucomicrobia subdivision 3 bacterium]|nr:immunoglobulin domain-containing protein [Limisphaerales bacterium]
MKAALAMSVLTLCLACTAGHATNSPAYFAGNYLVAPTNAKVGRLFSSPPSPVAPPQADSPAPSLDFEALGDNNTMWPPDTHGAVGPNHVMITLNSQVRIQNRLGTTNYSTVALNEFWFGTGATGVGAFDPRITYDPFEGRFISVAEAVSNATFYLLLGASATSDPTGTWYKHRILLSGSEVPDHPNLGFNRNWVVSSMNILGTNHSRIWVFNKTNLYSGASTSSLLYTNFWTNGFGICPATTHDNSLTNIYLVQEYNGNTTNAAGANVGFLRLFEISGPVNSPVLSNRFVQTTLTWTNQWGDFHGENKLPQLGITNRIHSFDARMNSVAYRNGFVWCTHTVFLPPSNVTRAAVQWYKVRTNGDVFEEDRIQDVSGTNSYAFPSIAVNRFNDMLIGYSKFAATQYVSANYSFRAFFDEVAGKDRRLKAGHGPYARFGGEDFSGLNRWGDYSGTVVDPVNDADLWTIQEYAAQPINSGTNHEDGRWGTWSGKISVPLPTNDAFSSAQTIADAQGSATNTNRRATKETGEPNHGGNTGGSSIWYAWTAAHTGQAVIDTIGSTFNTLLAVYTGSTVSNLALVASNDNAGSLFSSRVVFDAASNTTYRIAVDGFGGNSGTAVVNWCQSFAPVIVSQPESTNVVANANENATFAVLACGIPTPLAYQWRFKHTNSTAVTTNIAGGTNTSYTISNVLGTNAGSYSVVVTNSSGSVTSALASLIVHADSAARLSLFTYENETFRMHISGLTNRPYRVETATNLNPSVTWTPIFTNIVSYWYTNFAATNDGRRFYRTITNSF